MDRPADDAPVTLVTKVDGEERKAQMIRKIVHAIGMLAAIGLATCSLIAQQSQTPLTNADVISMVKVGMPTQPILDLIRCRQPAFDLSDKAKTDLYAAGGTERASDMKQIWDTMTNATIAKQTNGRGGEDAGLCSQSSPAPGAGTPSVSAQVTPSNSPTAVSGPRWQMPTVTLVQSSGPQEMPLEKTQLAETKTKPQSLASLAGDSAVTQGIQAGVNDVSWNAASHINSGVGSSAVGQAGSIFGGMLSRRQPEATYVWGVPGPASANVLQTTMPKFEVNFAKAPGVNPEEFAPEIVRLTPAQNTCRLAGATRGREDARSRDAADWEIYSGFVEDRVAVALQKRAAGEYEVTPQSPLLPGEYAVVLRPVSRNEKFSGGDVARGQGAGLMFDTLWSFQVAGNAQ